MSTVFEHRETFPGDVDPVSILMKAYALLEKNQANFPTAGPPLQWYIRMERVGDQQYLTIALRDPEELSSPWAGLVALAFIIIVIVAFIWPWL